MDRYQINNDTHEKPVAAHTPGPWEMLLVAFSDRRVWITIDEDGAAECDVRIDGANAQANANLIVAAPDMLAALKNTLSLLKLFTRETDDIARAAWEEAEAAITKATGAQP